MLIHIAMANTINSFIHLIITTFFINDSLFPQPIYLSLCILSHVRFVIRSSTCESTIIFFSKQKQSISAPPTVLQ